MQRHRGALSQWAVGAGFAATALIFAPDHAVGQRHAGMIHSSAAIADTMPTGMPLAGPLGISMERMGSGTTWIPDAVTLPSHHFMAGRWNVMLHGFVFGQYDRQGGSRGGGQFGSLNWGMIMAERTLAGGRFQFRFMPSLDPLTVGCGYPLLAQSGEACRGKALVDKQHPHDVFMELGALYEKPVSSNLAVLLYVAPVGEPALGPVAFMHRPSAMDEPQAPIGHHWQDATHISYGVVTAGLFTRTIRLEASAFNGHEPDEHRWGFDPLALNSLSGRLTVNPNANWSFTTGYGHIDNPERAIVRESVHRLTASAMYGRALGSNGQWATTVIYGRNENDAREMSHSVLMESEAMLGERNTFFGRSEIVQKSAEDLQIATLPPEQLFNVKTLSLGYIRELSRGRGVTLGVGARATVNLLPQPLAAWYGSRAPVGGMVFLRLRPIRSKSHEAAGMDATIHHEHP
jgi:hypothetical protein